MLRANIKHRHLQEVAQERQTRARQLAEAAPRPVRLPARRNRLLARLNTLVQALSPRLLDKVRAG
ncbi:MAG: hypothetical protein ACOC9Z_04300 [Chloroflexota bacterium]